MLFTLERQKTTQKQIHDSRSINKKSGRFLSDGSTCILRTTSISNRYKYQLERRSYDLMRKIYTFLFRNEPLFNQTLSLSMIDNVLPFESLR